MDLRPAYALTLAEQQWTTQLLALDVRLAAAPLTGTVSARMAAAAPLQAAPGDPVSLDLDGGDQDGGGGSLTVFTGAIAAIQRDPYGITVHAVDAAGTLAQLRPATTYEQVNAGTVITDLADQAGIDIGDIDDGVALAWYAADPSRTALDHVARLAGWSGGLARIGADGSLVATAVPATQAELALKFGRELLALDQASRARPIEGFSYAGEAGAGSTDSPDALRPTSDFFGGNRPDGPDASHRWAFEPALRTTDAAGSAGAAAKWRYSARSTIGSLTAFLQPTLRPGTVIEIAELPDPLSGGPVWLDRIRHRIDSGGARTTARMYAGGPPAGDLSGSLGSLAGAVAGALGI
jgi:hypothetical protein